LTGFESPRISMHRASKCVGLLLLDGGPLSSSISADQRSTLCRRR
jgi:hypothetical protein